MTESEHRVHNGRDRLRKTIKCCPLHLYYNCWDDHHSALKKSTVYYNVGINIKEQPFLLGCSLILI